MLILAAIGVRRANIAVTNNPSPRGHFPPNRCDKIPPGTKD